MSFNVGLNVLEVDGKATPSIQAAPTSVAAFVIRSQRGVPEAVRRVTNWSQFTQYFGGYVDQAHGAYAIRGFFDNGGTTAYVTRVVDVQAAAPTPAFATSGEAPWNLQASDTLSFSGDFSEQPVTTDAFEAVPAKIQGLAGPFDLTDGEAARNLGFKLEDRESDLYTFDPADFGDSLATATAGAVAAVLNREFQGIQAWVDAADGLLRIRTDRGAGSSLEALGTAAAALGFEQPEPAKGGGNVAYLDAVTASEAEAVIRAAFVKAKVEIGIEKLGERIRIQHPQAGADHSISVTDSSEAFVFQITPGTDSAGPGGALAASKEFLNGGTKALVVHAGYRGQEDPGAWGNDVKIQIAANPEESDTYDLSVQYLDNVVETWEKLDVKGGPKRHPFNVINDPQTGSGYITVSVPTEVTSNPARTVNAQGEAAFVPLQTGKDDALSGAALTNPLKAALALFDTYQVQLVCCPESDNAVVVTEALTYCANRGDCMFVGHTPKGRDAGGAKTYVKSGKFRGNKIYGALYFPWIEVADPIGSRKWIPPTGHVMGVYARTERERGIWKAPAGNAARLRGALDVQKHITDAVHTDLVKNANVNAVRFIAGQGIVIDSSRSLSTSTLWLYVNVRLLFNFVKSSLMSGLRWVVQEPNDETLWNKVKFNSVTPFLMGLWRRGAFGPGSPEEVFTVKVDGENNPPANIQQGIFNVEVYFYPSRPAETIVITVGQQEGGGSASEG